MRQPDEDKGVGDEPEEQGAERRAGEGPGATEDPDTADDHGGHDLERVAARGGAVDGPEFDAYMTPANRPSTQWRTPKTTSRDGLPKMAADSVNPTA